MKNLPLISVIVPVYNVEKYLKNCIDSVINQTYHNIEIILVDDGSTDNSGKICDEYAQSDSRIKVIHKKNGGLSDARNYGIENASGKYITFIDSDDTVENYYVSELYGLVKKYNTDIGIGTISIINNGNKRNMGKDYFEKVFDTKECLSYMLQEKGFTVSANAKLYSKSLFENIKYPKGKLYEDNGTTYKLILQCDKIAYSNKSIYNYCLRDDSITSQKFTMKKMDYIYLTDAECNDIIERYPELADVCEGRKAVARFSVLRHMLNSKLSDKENKEQEEIIKYLKNNYNSLMNNEFVSKKIKISLVLLRINKKILKLGAGIYEKIK